MRILTFSFQLSNYNSQILKLALPSVVANITVPLLGLVDTTIVGHMGRAEYIAAVAIGSTIFNMLYWLFGFLRMGTTGLVSQAHGAGDDQSIRESLLHSLVIGAFISLCLLLLQTPLLRLCLWLMSPSDDVAQYTASYFRVCIWGAPAMLASYSLTGWFIGMKDTRTPMWIAILQNLLNILCTLIFVFVFHLGVCGVALGTVVGLYSGCIYAVYKIRRNGYEHGLCFAIKRVKGEYCKSIKNSVSSVYVYIFLRTLCLVAVTVYFTTAGSRMGTLTLDANAILMQFFIVYSYFTDGLANAAEALSGNYLGRQDSSGLRLIIRRLLLWGFCLALFFMVLYASIGSYFLYILTNQQEVVSFALHYLPWVVVIPLMAFSAFIWDGVYIGMTLTRQMFQSMLASSIVFFVLWLVLESSYGNHALWLAFVAYLGTRSLMQTILFYYCHDKVC